MTTLREAALAAWEEEKKKLAKARAERANEACKFVKERLGIDAEPLPGEPVAVADGIKFFIYEGPDVQGRAIMADAGWSSGIVNSLTDIGALIMLAEREKEWYSTEPEEPAFAISIGECIDNGRYEEASARALLSIARSLDSFRSYGISTFVVKPAT